MTHLLIVLFGLTLVYAAASSRVEAYIRTLAMQGLLLFLMVMLDFGKIAVMTFGLLAVETLLFKTIAIPMFLTYTVRKNGIVREEEPYIPNYFSVLITTVILGLGFGLSFWVAQNAKNANPLYFGISVSAILAGLFMILVRKKVITHVMGYVMMENGIFMLAISVASEMPLIVNMGVLLDLFAAIFMLGLFVSRIHSTFDELHIDSLSDLRD